MSNFRLFTKPKYSNSRALIIGINEYQNMSPLAYAVNDAQEVRNVLINELAFPEKDVLSLEDQDATRENILRSFLRFAEDGVDIDDRILVFFAGHGHTRPGNRGEVGYLVPYNADKRDASTLIRWDDLTRNSELICAKHMLFIMDACYGGLAVTRNLQPGSARFLKDMIRRYSRQVLTAGKANEVVADAGGPLPNHSVFTGHLIEGLRGGATSDQGVITANGLMAYVYKKVATDANSNQTPHYGYFDGDGDFIITAPQLENLGGEDNKGLDSLIIHPAVEEEYTPDTFEVKVSKVKRLLADESATIELHDYIVKEVRQFLSVTSDDNFVVQGNFSKDEFLDRLSRYEAVGKDLAAITACTAYWARPAHRQILQKIIMRATDRIEPKSGCGAWLALRWYPLIFQLYCAGIAAIEAQRYDSLACIFYCRVGSSQYGNQDECFVEAAANAILEFNRAELFKQLPGHEKKYVPLSEYLYKTLQPLLDDVFFVGKKYEYSFDEFEVIFALASAYMRVQRKESLWGPFGRFSWKRGHQANHPLARVIEQAKVEGDNWAPLQQGVFGGKSARFLEVAAQYQDMISGLNWR